MSIHIYNTLTREKEEFSPLKKGMVSMYVCGPTVYDDAHIGHARGAFVFSVVKAYLEYRGLKVRHIQNVTDIDDKIIDRARELSQPGDDLKARVREVARKHLASYREDMAGLGIPGPDEEPKATEHIEDMFDLIEGLIDKGMAYEAGGDVYFRVNRAAGYGKLSHQSLAMMESGARIKPGENKENPLDFALWKRSKIDEPSWRRGRLEGRPGWHIECSAMSMSRLGETFDIHGGGLDLVFPHHENEIAQSEAATGKPFARYWMHNGLLTINGQKMAKSLGNFITVRDYIKRYEDADLLKLLFLSAHYRSPVDFTAEKIDEARLAKERFLIFFDRAEAAAKDTSRAAKPDREAKEMIDGVRQAFEMAMDDDLNTAQALAALFEGVTRGNEMLDGDMPMKRKAPLAVGLKELILELGGILGLMFGRKEIAEERARDIEKKIEQRNEARRNRDFKMADKIRKELADEGVILEDARSGTTWRLRS